MLPISSWTGGQFGLEKCTLNVNQLECKNILYRFGSLCNNSLNCHVLLKIENKSAGASNKMGNIRSLRMGSIVHDIGTGLSLRTFD